MLSAEDTEINKIAALKQLTLVKETFKKTKQKISTVIETNVQKVQK